MQEVATGFGLVEGPVWDAGRGLYFSDVQNGGVFLLGLDGQVATAVPKRKGVGGIALHEDGGLVFSGRDISWSDLAGGGAPLLTPDQAMAGAIGFNDLTTDSRGRVFVGSLAFVVFGGGDPKPAGLHVIELDGSSRQVSDGVFLTNGLGFSPDGRRLYHSDSRSELVRAYDVSAAGEVGAWTPLTTFPKGGVPDGLKVAADGSVWVADAGAGRVAVFEADGTHRMDVKVPLPMVTSLCWGGADLKDLYIVTGSRGGTGGDCGTIFKMRTDVAGLPLTKAKVRHA